MKHEEFYFENLFTQHLIDWPKRLALNLHTQVFSEAVPTNKGYEIIKYKNFPWNGEKNGYIVENLGKIEDEILDKYLGRNDEVIWSYLNRSFGIVIHEAAYYLQMLNMKDLRKEPVKKHFEEGLKIVINEKKEETSWPLEQIDLAKRYFSVNYPERDQK
jgi:hypothetical protein